MIEKIVIDYLSENLDVPIHMEHPRDPEESYVIVEKTGSGKQDHICSATLAVQSYAGSLYKACKLNENVKEAMENLVSVNEVTHVGLNTDYNYTDTTKSLYRYQAVFNITHY